MAEPTFSRATMHADDDLPRTLRRERDAQARRARENELQDVLPASAAPVTVGDNAAAPFAGEPYGYDDIDASHVTVARLDIPFLHLMLFFLKAVIAAVPALIVLLVILWGIGEILTAYFPQLIKMQILIRMPS